MNRYMFPLNIQDSNCVPVSSRLRAVKFVVCAASVDAYVVVKLSQMAQRIIVDIRYTRDEINGERKKMNTG